MISECVGVGTNETWHEFFHCTVVCEELKRIKKYLKIKNNITPECEKILRFSKWNLNDIKVLNIGLAPYPQKGVATGRAFEVNVDSLENNEDTWDNTEINPSLKNLIKILYLCRKQIVDDISLNKVRKEINDKTFEVKKPSEIFDEWEKKGVYFINKSFTTEIDESKKHLYVWDVFFYLLLYYITEKNDEIWYVLWGEIELKDRLKLLGVDKKRIIVMPHPRNWNIEEINKGLRKLKQGDGSASK